MKRQQPRTRSGLLPEACHLVLPKGIKSSGSPAVRETCRRIGINFDEWQRDLNKCLLAKDSAGLYAADTAVLSIARQVGKTFDVGAVAFALCIAIPGLTVVWTAHRFKVSRESFNEMRSWAKRSELTAHIDYDAITTAAGNECIPFRNGSRIIFAARERGAIRGFTKVGMLVLDEAQILTEAAMSDLIPTTNQAPNPLIILMGTPPKPTDPSEVFTRLRTEALTGESQDVLYVEFSAPPDCDPDDRSAWRIANPSYPARTSAKAILRLRKLLSLDDFKREALGIWDEQEAGALRALWPSLVDIDSDRPLRPALAVDITPDRVYASIAAAGRTPDGLTHVDVLEHGPYDAGLVDRVVALAEEVDACVVVLDPSGPAGALIPEFEENGIRVKPDTGEMMLDALSAREAAQAHGVFVDLAVNKLLRHRNRVELNDALAGAKTRALADALAWSRKHSSVDISPLVACTNASYGFAVHGVEPDYNVLESVL